MIKINNENLANYIMFKLDKLDNEFTEEELNQITEVVVNYDEEENTVTVIDELPKLKHLKSITFRNGYIDNIDYHTFSKLNDLDEVVFERCEFENADLIASLELKSLSLINCDINSYDFIYIIEGLEELTVINGKIDFIKLNLLNKLRYLQLSYSNIVNGNLNINALEELYIDNTDINDFTFVKELTNLKKISIDKKQYENNKELFDELINNNIVILYENFAGFGGDDNAL